MYAEHHQRPEIPAASVKACLSEVMFIPGSEIFKRNQIRKINLIKAFLILIGLMGNCSRDASSNPGQIIMNHLGAEVIKVIASNLKITMASLIHWHLGDSVFRSTPLNKEQKHSDLFGEIKSYQKRFASGCHSSLGRIKGHSCPVAAQKYQTFKSL